jgi:glutamyl-tRNA synthetase
MSSTNSRLRFAPSPTGYLHIGGARTALFNWLWARRTGGKFVLRIEDTDRGRSTPESLQAILEGLKWLEIDWDEGPEVGGEVGPYFQFERLELYRQHAEQLVSEGKAYRCYCTREELEQRRAAAAGPEGSWRYEGVCRAVTAPPEGKSAYVIRFRVPSGPGTVSFLDRVLGRIGKEYSDLDDFVMVRPDGMPLYNFACVVDDHLMGITVVGRGQEHINSTIPQLMLYQAFGWEPPEFAHFPLILGPDREKLSKRRHPEADVMLHKRNGILPEALLNFIVRLGWSHGDDEIIPREQQLEWFDFAQVGTTSGVWNPDKLLWLNQHYLKTLPEALIAARLRPFLEERGYQGLDEERVRGVVVALRPRARTLVEMAEMARYFFTEGVQLDEKAAQKHLTADSRPLLEQVRSRIAAMATWSVPELDGVVKEVSEAAGVGMGKVAQPVRVAVTGGTASPGIGETLLLVGKEESLRRIDAALSRIG